VHTAQSMHASTTRCLILRQARAALLQFIAMCASKSSNIRQNDAKFVKSKKRKSAQKLSLNKSVKQNCLQFV